MRTPRSRDAALFSEFGSGVPSYTADTHHRALRVEGGWLEVPNDHTRVLAGAAEAVGQ